MYIKEIKINGFKSFADKVNIELSSDFTGIVGPNGSGKSNIVDAVKWVLGEQSIKNLRASDGMTDIIFNGSKSRPPANSASVSITFDNKDKSIDIDYTEVMIKRIVYRTGENEYYLNNTKCRLKDITDLFIDHFTSKDSINIIPQGEISQLLSSKPEDRRVIFESAAGVLKYKKRKEESLRRLSKTHDNIERVDMIINELETSVKPLEEQAKKATIYKEASNKLKSVEISLITHDLTMLNTQKIDNEEKINNLNNSLVSVSSTSSKEEVKLEKLKLENIKLNSILSESQTELMKINEEMSELSNKMALAKERVKYDKDNNEIKTNLMHLKEQKLMIENKIDELKEDIKLLELEEKSLTETLSVFETEFNVHNKKKDLLMGEFNKITKLEFELKGKQDYLINSINNNSRMPFSVRSVIDNPILKGIKNTIGNIVNVKEEYTTMLEVALGSNINTIVCENEQNAKDAIIYLRNNNKGRVTLFPLSVIKPRSIEPDIIKLASSIPGYIDIASNLVEFDNTYYNIIMNTLGNIIVASDENSGVEISKKINRRYRVVTLTGEIIHIGGSLTGGSIKLNSTISEKYELEETNNKLNKLNEEKEKVNNELKDIDYNTNIIKESINKKNIELVKLKETLFSKTEISETYNKELDNISGEIKDLSLNTKEKIDKNINNIMEEYYKVEAKKIKLESIFDTNTKKRNDINEEIVDTESIIKRSNSSNNSILEELRKEEVENTKINMNMDTLLNRLNEEYSVTYEKAKSEYIFEGNLEESRKEVNELRKQIKSLGSVNIGSIEEYERVSKRYNFLCTQKEDLIKSENNLLEIIKDMDDVMIDKFADTFNKINVEFNKVFASLFGGGTAHLSMTDPKNVLETGIEITAYPPGKKPSVISLLSGGEKTLTAISLLFSIMNLKSVPFAILDEIESALDDVNVDKFGNYINNYKGKTQLLIITHKKKTMEYVNELYGVTMQESGVSKLVSVKLEGIE